MTQISPVLLREAIGRKLRAAREGAGFTLSQAAPRLDVSQSTLSRIENGQPINVHLLRTMMDLYDIVEEGLIDLVRQSRRPGWYKEYGISDHDFIALETGARAVSNFQLSYVPGLLQTADYARALYMASPPRRTAEQIANQLAVRLIRQERLADDEPLRLGAVVSEGALWRPVGGPKVMAAQLRHLALAAELPSVDLRVLPHSVITDTAMKGSFAILEFSKGGRTPIVYLDHALGADRRDRAEVVHAAKIQFDNLRSLALDPERSMELIERVVAGL